MITNAVAHKEWASPLATPNMITNKANPQKPPHTRQADQTLYP